MAVHKETWEDWMVFLEEALEFRKEKEKYWERWRNWYRYAGPTAPRTGEFRVHLIRPLIQILLPALYFKNPYIIVNPLTYDDDNSAQRALYQEAWLNYFFASGMDSKRQIRRCVLDALTMNNAIIESKWRYQTEERTTKTGGLATEYEEYVVADSPYLMRVSPWDFVYDPFSMNGLSGARWCARRKWMTIESVRENKYFNEKYRTQLSMVDRKLEQRGTIRRLIQATRKLLDLKDRTGTNTGQSTLDEAYEGFVQVWYIYDRKYQRHMVITPTVPGFLIDEENPYSHLRAFPYKELVFEFDTDMDQPMSLIQQVIPQATEFNETRQRQSEYLKRFARMYEVEFDAFDDEEEGERLMRQGKDGTVLKVTKRGKIGEVPAVKMDVDLWRWVEAQRGDAQFSMSIPATQTGTGHSKFKSATEVAQISSSFDIRLDDLREAISEFVEGIADITGANIQVFLDERRKFQIVGLDGTESVEDIGPDDIGGYGYGYQVLLSEAAPENEDKRLARWKTIYMITQNEPLLNRYKVLFELLRSLSVRNPRSYYMGQDMPGNTEPYGAGQRTPAGPEEGDMGMVEPGMEAMMMGGMMDEMGQ